MAGLIYYDTNAYESSGLYDILKTIPNFWDSTDDETSALVKGGITLTLGESKSISGYGKSTSLMISTLRAMLIAATEKGLVVYFGTTVNASGVIAIGCDKDGNWAAAWGGNGTASSGSSAVDIKGIIADGVSATSYLTSGVQTSDVMTQIIDLATDKGNFIFEDVRRVYYMPNITYRGKLTMPNGEKYVKCGAFALRYTE